MNQQQYDAKVRSLKGAVTKARNKAKRRDITLEQKLAWLQKANANAETLRQHLLHVFDLVTE